MHWSGYDATALDIEIDPQRCRFGSRKSNFALQAKPPEAVCVRLVAKKKCKCVFITAGPIIKLCAGGEGDSEGHVL